MERQAFYADFNSSVPFLLKGTEIGFIMQPVEGKEARLAFGMEQGGERV